MRASNGMYSFLNEKDQYQLRNDQLTDLSLLTPSSAVEGRRDSVASAQSLASFSSSSSLSTLKSPLGPVTPPASTSFSHEYFHQDASVSGTPSPLGDDVPQFQYTLRSSIDEKDPMGSGSEPRWLLCQQPGFSDVQPTPTDSNALTPFYQDHSTFEMPMTTQVDDSLTGMYEPNNWEGQTTSMSMDLSGLPYPVVDNSFSGMGYPYNWTTDVDSGVVEPGAVIPSSSTIVPSDAEFFPGDVKGEPDRNMDGGDSPLVCPDPSWSHGPSRRMIEDSGDIDSMMSRLGGSPGHIAERNSLQVALRKHEQMNKTRVKTELGQGRLASHVSPPIDDNLSMHQSSPRKVLRKPYKKRGSHDTAVKKRSRKHDALRTVAREETGVIFMIERGLCGTDGKLEKPVLPAKKQKFVCGMDLDDGTRCEAKFERAEHRKRHMTTTHAVEPKYPCVLAECKRKFTRQDNRRDHYKTHLNQAQQPRNARVDAKLLFDGIRKDPTENAASTIQKLKESMAKNARERRAMCQ